MALRNILAPLSALVVVLTLAGCAADGLSEAVAIERVSSSSDQLGREDGYIPDGESVRLGDDIPAVTRLDPRLRDALVRAGEAAEAEHGIEITIADGWRSERYQQYLFDQAVAEYGSEEEASRWVKRGDASQHTRGEAVDIATADAMDWLSRFGAEYGLCQVYANENWHYELVADAFGTCPEQLPDGTAG